MEQTRVLKGRPHCIGAGFKIYKRVKLMLWICARVQKTIKYIKKLLIFVLWVIHVFAEFYKTYFGVHCLCSSQENNSNSL